MGHLTGLIKQSFALLLGGLLVLAAQHLVATDRALADCRSRFDPSTAVPDN